MGCSTIDRKTFDKEQDMLAALQDSYEGVCQHYSGSALKDHERAMEMNLLKTEQTLSCILFTCKELEDFLVYMEGALQ